MWEGKCWCGRPKNLWNKYQRKYCTTEHGSLWYYGIRAYWDQIRLNQYKLDNGICQMCKKPAGDNYQCDHELALCLGGYMFDNVLRTLCIECHKIKTKSDKQKLAKLRSKT